MTDARGYFAGRREVSTPSGNISYIERGEGPVALFVHGVLLNGYLWRHQLASLADTRRCVAIDLLGHGYTDAMEGQELSVTANAHMLAQFLDALEIPQVDLVGNDSGGGICQIFAALYPQRLRSLVLTNCDAHDNWPPQEFQAFVSMVAAGGLEDTLAAMLTDKQVFREALAPAYEQPEALDDATIEAYLRPFADSPKRLRELEGFVNAFDSHHTLAIESGLRRLQAPTLVAWGTDDIYFPLEWSHWLAQTIPGTRRRIEFKGARIFFPEERWRDFNRELCAFWDEVGPAGDAREAAIPE